MHLGPTQIVVGLSVEFRDEQDVPAVEACVERIEAALKQKVPEIVAVFVMPQAPDAFRRQVAQIVE